MNNYWHIQKTEPLYPDLLWSRPETRQGKGKLLIIGGNAHGFAHVAEAYAAAEKAGAGYIRVLMPEAIRPHFSHFQGQTLEIEYAPSGASGGFAKNALASFFDASDWADGILLAGDFGKNSETTTILDGYLLRNGANVTIADNTLESIRIPYNQLLQRELVLVISLRTLQKFVAEIGHVTAITSDIGNPKLAEILHEISSNHSAHLVVIRDNDTWVASGGKVVSTPVNSQNIPSAAAVSAVWTLQNPTKAFEALTTALFTLTDR